MDRNNQTIDYNELDLVNQLTSALDIDIDDRGLLLQSFMNLTISDGRRVLSLAVPIKGVCLQDGEIYFQPLNNNKHNKFLIGLFLQQYPMISDISFEGTGIIFKDINNNPIYVESDTANPKEGIIRAILNYINSV